MTATRWSRTREGYFLKHIKVKTLRTNQVSSAETDGPIVPFGNQKFSFSLRNLDISIGHERKCCEILHRSFAFHQVLPARLNVSWRIFPCKISISNTTPCCTQRTRVVQLRTLSTVSILSKAPQDVDVLTALNRWVPRSRPNSRRGLPKFHPWSSWLVSKHQGKSRSLRTKTRNSEIQDGEDVDILRRPDPIYNGVKRLISFANKIV